MSYGSRRGVRWRGRPAGLSPAATERSIIRIEIMATTRAIAARLAAMLLLLSPSSGFATQQNAPPASTTGAAQPADHPAEVAIAADVYRYYEFIADGFFVFRVTLSGDGQVNRIRTLRDPGGSMVSGAISAIQTWKFNPAIVSGSPKPSELTVAFVYPPRVNAPVVGRFDPVIPEPRLNPPPRHNGGHRDPEHSGYAPTGIISVAYANEAYAMMSTGSVVAQVSVDEEGKATSTQILYGSAPLAGLALEAFGKWQFQAAIFNGKPMPSKIVLAYVFPPPVVVTPY
jgi:hypothetical protein